MGYKSMKRRAEISGGSVRGAKIRNGQILFEAAMTFDPSYNGDIYLWEPETDTEDLKKIPVCFFGEDIQANEGLTLKFNCPAGVLPKIGDVLWDRAKGKYLLVSESFDRAEMHGAGKAVLCQMKIKWQDGKGYIREYPAADINAANYGTGVGVTSLLSLGNVKHILLMPCDKNTLLLSRDKRLFLYRDGAKPSVFKITQNDNTSRAFGKGIVRLTVSEDEYDPEKDDISAGICDRKSSPGRICVNYSGEASVRAGGEKRFFTESPADFSLTGGEDVLNALTLTALDDCSCIVAVRNDPSVIGRHFTVRAADENAGGEALIFIGGGI